MKEKLIAAGVKNLRQYGYPHCNSENILTDQIYKAFFVSMLKENFGLSPQIDKSINELLIACGADK